MADTNEHNNESLHSSEENATNQPVNENNDLK